MLPGQTATFANYSGYIKGINGVIVDIANLINLPDIEDFSFAVGNDNNPAGWAQAPSPTYINVYPGRGTGGSTQITLIWDDNDIQDEWLRVTLIAQPDFNLAANDVFYFGNQIGETGNSPGDTFVDASDMVAVRDNVSAGGVAVSNRYDLNKDGFADGGDMVVARDHVSDPGTQLRLIAVPASPAAAAPDGAAISEASLTTASSTSPVAGVAISTGSTSPAKPPTPGGSKTAPVKKLQKPPLLQTRSKGCPWPSPYR